MKEYQARNEGLSFTGIYEWAYERESLKVRAATIRKEYKCRAILVPDEGKRGLSIYAGQEYFDAKRIEVLTIMTSGYSKKLNKLREKYEQELQDLEEDQEKKLLELSNLKEKTYVNV